LAEAAQALPHLLACEVAASLKQRGEVFHVVPPTRKYAAALPETVPPCPAVFAQHGRNHREVFAILGSTTNPAFCYTAGPKNCGPVAGA
jgi:hypothetical protein